MLVNLETFWETIIFRISQKGAQDFFLSTEMLGKWSPQEVRSMNIRLKSIINVVFPTSGKEEGLKAHVMEQSSIGLSVSKRIDIPSNSWGNSELLTEPLMTLNKVFDNVLIVGSALISMDPSSHEDFESSLLDKLLKSLLSLLSGSNVPHV